MAKILCKGEHARGADQSDVNAPEGVLAPPRDFERQIAYSECDESCFCKLWNVLRFDAIMPDGSVIADFVALGESVGTALTRLPVAPRLIVRIHYEGYPRGPHWEEDGYIEQTTRVKYLWGREGG